MKYKKLLILLILINCSHLNENQFSYEVEVSFFKNDSTLYKRIDNITINANFYYIHMDMDSYYDQESGKVKYLFQTRGIDSEDFMNQPGEICIGGVFDSVTFWDTCIDWNVFQIEDNKHKYIDGFICTLNVFKDIGLNYTDVLINQKE